MTTQANNVLSDILNKHQEKLINSWFEAMIGKLSRRDKALEGELKRDGAQFLEALSKAAATGGSFDFRSPVWNETKQLLSQLSQLRLRQGFTPMETALFVFALKTPLFALIREELASQPLVAIDETARTGELFDSLGLYTMEEYQKSREMVISRQQQELLELSTPVVQLWHNVLALPLIGTLDSARTQIVMENLLQKIIETGASIAIIDITGVPTVDTLVAQHLLKTVSAARLMGADCIISGIRPQIAQTIVHLGVNLEDVTTKATLADAFQVALKRTGAAISTVAAEK